MKHENSTKSTRKSLNFLADHIKAIFQKIQKKLQSTWICSLAKNGQIQNNGNTFSRAQEFNSTVIEKHFSKSEALKRQRGHKSGEQQQQQKIQETFR